MNWLFPSFLAGGLLIGLPIALHFLRSRPKTIVRFPSLRFLDESAIRDTRKHRLRRWLTLALRVLVITLLAMAFARPFWINQQAARRGVMIIAVDNSMSMQAKGRWEESRRWALAQIASLESGDQVGILLMNPTPKWLLPLTDDHAGVRSALAAMEPGFETTRYGNALRVAGDILAANPARTKTLVWMADEQRLGWLGTSLNKSLPSGVKLRLQPIATPPTHQAAITDLRWVEGSTAVEVKIRLYEPEEQTREVVVSGSGKTLASAKVTLKKGAENIVRLPITSPRGVPLDGIRVSLDADDLPADDRAWLAASSQKSISVLFTPASSEQDFLPHALNATRMLTEGSLEAIPFPQGEWPANAVGVVRGTEFFTPPLLPRLDRFVEEGGALLLFVDGSEEQAQWLANHGITVSEQVATEAPLQLRDWDSEHPSLSAFAGQSLLPLMGIEFYQGCSFRGENLLPVANWPDGTMAIAEWNTNGRRMLLCGFPIDRRATDWLVHPSFVPFIHQSVRWLNSFSVSQMNWRVGEVIPLPPSSGTAEATWRALDSSRPQPIQSASGSVRAEIPGLYEFFDGKKRQVFSVNAALDESDLLPWPDFSQLLALESSQESHGDPGAPLASVPLSDVVAESQQRLWWWLLAICGLGMLAEVGLANRTSI